MRAVALDCFVMQAVAGTDIAKLVAALEQEPSVELVQPVQTFEALGTGQIGKERQRAPRGPRPPEPLAARRREQRRRRRHGQRS